MVTPRGRATSPIRVPQLLRDYLAGTVMGAADSTEQAALRLQEGDYIAHIHQRVKARIKELAEEFTISYQYPRAHSFASLVANLLLLGLLERTGRREEPEERGAGKVGTGGGFQARTYVRLASGWQGRPEWRNPMAYVVALYAGLAPPEAPAPPPPTPPRPPPPAPRRRRGPAPPRAAPTAPPPPPVVPEAQLADLEFSRANLVAALLVAESATSPAEFQALLQEAETFLAQVRSLFRISPFPGAQGDLDLLRNCIILLERASTAASQAIALSNCQNSARVLAESLSPPRVSRRVTPAAPPAVTPGGIPTLELPARPSRRAVDRLQRHLEALASVDPGDPAVGRELERLGVILADWSIELEDSLADAEGDRADRIEQQIEVLNETAQALEDGDLEAAGQALASWT